MSAWDELDQLVADTAVKQWHFQSRLRQGQIGGYFEHKSQAAPKAAN